MKFIPITLLLYSLVISSGKSFAQADISKSLADPVTQRFDNLDLSVKEYLKEVLLKDTTCCLEANYYLSVQYDATGTVTMAKPMTRTSDCTTKLLKEAAYKIRWDARRNIETKTIYLKLNIDPTCNN